jgi:hypothetical protein
MYKYKTFIVTTSHTGIHYGKHAVIMTLESSAITFEDFCLKTNLKHEFLGMREIFDSFPSVQEAKRMMEHRNEYCCLVVVERMDNQHNSGKPAVFIVKG